MHADTVKVRWLKMTNEHNCQVSQNYGPGFMQKRKVDLRKQ